MLVTQQGGHHKHRPAQCWGHWAHPALCWGPRAVGPSAGCSPWVLVSQFTKTHPTVHLDLHICVHVTQPSTVHENKNNVVAVVRQARRPTEQIPKKQIQVRKRPKRAGPEKAGAPVLPGAGEGVMASEAGCLTGEEVIDVHTKTHWIVDFKTWGRPGGAVG